MIKKDIKSRMKSYFFKNPSTRKRVRQIERELNLSLPSVIRYCKELKEEKILKKEEVAGTTLFSADRISEKFLFEKRFYNIKLLLSSGLIEYIKKELSNPSIVVFGSYSKGEDIEESDIDLYIQTPSKQTKKKLKLDKFQEKLNRRIQLFVYKEIGSVENPHLANNILNGIVLNGFIEVFE